MSNRHCFALILDAFLKPESSKTDSLHNPGIMFMVWIAKFGWHSLRKINNVQVNTLRIYNILCLKFHLLGLRTRAIKLLRVATSRCFQRRSKIECVYEHDNEYSLDAFCSQFHWASNHYVLVSIKISFFITAFLKFTTLINLR